MNKTRVLAHQLTQAGYPGLFYNPGHEAVFDRIWASASPEDFKQLAGDNRAPSLARFLSSAMLLQKDVRVLPTMDLSVLSQTYIDALVNNYTGRMTDWGFLNSNTDMGITGSLFLLFGEKAIPHLIPLLDNAGDVIYVRPEPDVTGLNRTILQKVRIKDFAALYISMIKNIPVEFKTTFSERDNAIDELKNRLSGR